MLIVLIAIDIPHPSNFAEESKRVLFTFIAVGIAGVITLIVNELQMRYAQATQATTQSRSASSRYGRR